MAEPRVSVVMAVYNGEEHVGQAVDSILGQTLDELELIVIDDGSTDETAVVLGELSERDSRIKVVRNGYNRGLAASLNRGIGLAQGVYIARQDADDLSLPGRLMKQTCFLDGHSEVGICGTAYEQVDEKDGSYTVTPPLSDTSIRWQMLLHNAFCHTSVMLRRTVWERVTTGYREDVRYSQDYELWTRFLRVTRVVNLPEVLAVRRAQRSSVSSTRQEEQQAIATRISARQIAGLAPQLQLTNEQVGKLRTWYQNQGTLPGEERAQACLHLWRLLGAFSEQADVDRNSVREIRKVVRRRIVSSLWSMRAGRKRRLQGIWQALGVEMVTGVLEASWAVYGRRRRRRDTT